MKSGERALPLSAPLDAFRRLLTPHRLAGKRCQSGVGRFLKVLGGANVTPIRRTEKECIVLRIGVMHSWILTLVSTLTSGLSSCCVTNSYQLPFFAELTISPPIA